jgi:hypothetical protein
MFNNINDLFMLTYVFDALVQFSNFQTINPQQQNKTKHKDAAIFEGFLRGFWGVYDKIAVYRGEVQVCNECSFLMRGEILAEFEAKLSHSYSYRPTQLSWSNCSLARMH